MPGAQRWQRTQWEHVAAAGEFSRTTQRLREVFLPDVTVNLGGSGSSGGSGMNGDLPVSVVATSAQCTPTLGPLKLGPRHGADSSSLAVRGFRVADAAVEGVSHGGWCAYVVCVNLCNSPNEYTLELSAGEELPMMVQSAQHEFKQVNSVPLTRNVNGTRLTDSLAGYATALYRLGCNGTTTTPATELERPSTTRTLSKVSTR